MKKRKVKKIIIPIIIAILIIIIIICYLFFVNKLDDRECLDCPYVEKLYIDNLIISRDNGNNLQTAPCFNNENAICYRAVLTLETLSSNLKATGEITIKYDCDYQTYNFGYGFSKYYINNNLTGRYTLNVEDMTSERVDIDIIRMDGSRINYINCDFDIEKVQGKLLIYGERVR